ncbi:MAG: molybdopterin-dependent oxidoreductase [Planctomycetes bacterium]|nr:molybdopterin-dependent oxidoreductase [Planctomycetota bacterium]
MAQDPLLEGVEPERYELFADPLWRLEVSRRDFIKAAGGGLFILCLLDESPAQDEAGRRGRGGAPTQDLAAWLHIDEKGAVTVYSGKAEVGQNIRTSLAQAVAEELRAPVDTIKVVMGDTALTPFDQGTFGSRSTPSMVPQLRRAGAAAREALADLAAAEWKVDRAALQVAGGKVTHPPSGRSLGFGELTLGQKLTKAVGAAVALTPPAEWKVAGTSVPKANGRDIVTGRHKYASDVHRPGMLFGKVLRPPAFNATLSSVDTKPAEAAGATVVRDGDFVGLAAATDLAAERALSAVQSEWKSTPQISSKELFDSLKKSAGAGSSVHAQGSVAEALKTAEVTLQGTYTAAYIAHAPLEPRAAVAEWTDGKLTVWTGTQRPFGVRSELAKAFTLPEDRVRVIVPDTGSGYGGKHTGEVAVEAARLAKAAGKPVKRVWTREEEFTWAYFRPAGLIEVRSGATKDGTLVAWEFHNYNSGGASIRPLYEIPHQKIEFHSSRSPLRQGSYRGLASTANTFARECHIDELARALGMDPLAFRLKNLKDARLRAVFEGAAGKFGWGRAKKEENQGFGIAGGFDKGGYVATCAELRVDRPSGKIRVVRAVTAFECGAVMNPDHLRNQVEGAVLMGLGGALFEAIEFEGGKISNPHFAQYRVPRLSDAPALETVLLDRKDLPSAGAGEAPIIAIAPAIGNALFDATGERRRSLPMA